MTLYPHQQESRGRVYAAYEAGADAVLMQGATGCHRAGQPVMMFDGSTKRVEDVAVGDLLMGPDSRARLVLSLCRGTGRMARIVPRRGAPFVVNEDHVLTLVRTGTGRRRGERGGELVDVTVREWFGWGITAKHLHKIFRVGVDFPVSPDAAPLPLDPYFLGLVLGDGCISQGSVSVCKPDIEVRDACEVQAILHGLRVTARDAGTTSVMWCLTAGAGAPPRANPITGHLRAMGLMGTTSHTKFVPPAYLVASRADRLALLAGLLDSDGHQSHNGFDWISASERLAEETAFLVRSLGLSAKIGPCQKRDQNGHGGTYWRISICGDCSVIPTRIPRKQAGPRTQKKDALRTGFRVERLPEPEAFYGFTLSGDGRYLLGDFLVTHNSGKTSTVVEGFILPSIRHGRRFVFAAHLEELIDDTASRLRAQGAPVGVVKAGRPLDPTAPVQVCSTQTLAPMLARGEELPPAHRFILDEAHRSSSSTNRAVIAHYKSTGAKILGLSATPCRGDEQPLDEFQALVCGPSVRTLIDGGYLVEPVVHAPAKVLTRGVAEDPAEVVNVRCIGRRAVVFAPTAADALAIATRIPGAETILDSTPFAVRSTVRDRLATGETQHLVTVRALLEGFDAPVLDAVILCGAFTTVAPYLQAIGRGLRPYTCPVTGRIKVDCWVFDLRGAVHLHGLPDDARRWSLEGAQGRSAVERPKPLRRCEDCHALFAPRTVCPACGSVHHSPVKMLRVQRAQMFAASDVPVAVRAEQWINGAVRSITARRPGISERWARATVLKKPPAWVREYLASLSASMPEPTVEDDHAAA